MLNHFFDKYIFTNTLKYTHNNFFLVNLPFFIMPVDVMVSLAGNSDIEMHKKIYLSFKENTKANFLPRFKQMGVEQEKILMLVKTFFVASGWGNIEIIDNKLESKRAIVVLDNSPFVTELKGKVSLSVDVFLRGILAGLFSVVFAEDVDCVESECAALSGERCKFIIKPKTEFDLESKAVQEQLVLD